MRGELFPMSMWERAVLESLERLEAALQSRRAPAASEPRDQKHERAFTTRSPNLLPLRKWAEASGVTHAHAYTLAREGRMPVIRLGRRIYVHLPSMETWVERGAQPDDLVHFELSDGGWITRLRDDLEQRS